ncbi:MAG: hypothetical protein JWM39_697 [Parcubacteria group bacterium]|nr:hypothetical protein [Parcubacteria group bacterium]
MQNEDPNSLLTTVRREAARLIQSISDGHASSVIALVDVLILHAHAAGASDMHILPGRKNICIRFRVDGVLTTEHAIPLSVHAELIARLKILSNLRTDEHHAAHDGRFRFTLDSERSVDIRISLAPTYYGENAVLRLLSLDTRTGTLEQLGFSTEQRAALEYAISRAHGLVLVTGPTGSGKTTTLYTLITVLAHQNQSIVTIEDPIEYSIDDISQIQVNPRTGFTFAHGLRSIVRQDPDVIMVGEIRDAETARLACTAALTGHLVLSTLHTVDATTALIRLRDQGIESYLIASSVTLIVAQRLVRRVCTKCSVERILNAGEKEVLETLINGGVIESLPMRILRGIGCVVCGGTGYRGRISICELLPIDDVIRDTLHDVTDARAIARIARERGMIPLMSDAVQKVADGSTTLEEIIRLHHT